MISYLRNRRTHLSEINPKVLVCLAARIILISYGFSRNIESIMTEITKIIIVNTNEIVTFFDILSLNIVIKKKQFVVGVVTVIHLHPSSINPPSTFQTQTDIP